MVKKPFTTGESKRQLSERERGHSRGKSTSKAWGHLLGEEAMGSFNMKTVAAELAGAVHSSYPLPSRCRVDVERMLATEQSFCGSPWRTGAV